MWRYDLKFCHGSLSQQQLFKLVFTTLLFITILAYSFSSLPPVLMFYGRRSAFYMFLTPQKIFLRFSLTLQKKTLKRLIKEYFKIWHISLGYWIESLGWLNIRSEFDRNQNSALDILRSNFLKDEEIFLYGHIVYRCRFNLSEIFLYLGSHAPFLIGNKIGLPMIIVSTCAHIWLLDKEVHHFINVIFVSLLIAYNQ